MFEGQVSYVHVDDSYKLNPTFRDGSDIAMGIYSGDLPPEGISCIEGQLSNIETEEVKVGDQICILGYPGEKNGNPY